MEASHLENRNSGGLGVISHAVASNDAHDLKMADRIFPGEVERRGI